MKLFGGNDPVKGAAKTTGRALLVLLSGIVLFALAVYCAMLILTHGPSADAKRLFVCSCNETSALKFVPSLCLPREEIDAILYGSPETAQTAEEAPAAAPAVRYTELAFESGSEIDPVEAEAAPAETPPPEQPALELLDVKGTTFKGKLLLVKDPERVIVGTLDHYGSGVGMYLNEYVEKYNAVAGTNAGGFDDPNGNGTGAIPDGLVIRDGAIAWGEKHIRYVDVVGFDADHRLHVGNMTGQEALDIGLVSAVSFTQGPILIQDGELLTGLGGGMNPRTCIGQRADGTVLLCVIEGRHPNSFGATYDDIAELMYSYGAVNAANLDGGSSSAMFYEGEQITKGSSIVGSRMMATAILVLREGGDAA